MQDLLLDYLLDQLDEPARREVERKLNTDPALAAQLDRLRAVLEPLDTWTAPPPPTRIVDDILDRIEAERLPRLLPASVLPPNERRGLGRRSIISLPELVALAACITFFIGVFVPTLSKSRHARNKTQCAANMAAIFGGLQSYAQAHAGVLPNAGLRRGDNWLTAAPNRRNLHLVFHLGYVEPQRARCPSRRDHEALTPDQASRLAALPDRRNLSYDMQHPDGPTCDMQNPVCTPVLADANPLFEGGRFNAVDNVREANTVAPRGIGQNILCADGHREWSTSPIISTCGDNIWTAGDATVYEGTEVQTCATDAFLIP